MPDENARPEYLSRLFALASLEWSIAADAVMEQSFALSSFCDKKASQRMELAKVFSTKSELDRTIVPAEIPESELTATRDEIKEAVASDLAIYKGLQALDEPSKFNSIMDGLYYSFEELLMNQDACEKRLVRMAYNVSDDSPYACLKCGIVTDAPCECPMCGAAENFFVPVAVDLDAEEEKEDEKEEGKE